VRTDHSPVLKRVLCAAGWPNITDNDFLSPFELMSFVLSLLLVFRTNSAYAR
jgi:predicted membrane chloride channel (bestrophin family)